MTLKRHLREESQIILLRNVVNDTLTTEMTTAHANSEPFEDKKLDMFTEVKSKAMTALLADYSLHSKKFESQASTDHQTVAHVLFEKFVSQVINNMIHVTNSLGHLGHVADDEKN